MRIVGVSGDGLGLARVRGRTVAIPGTLPGEAVDVTERPDPRGRPVFRAVAVREPSPHRVAEKCQHAPECGGCAWQHVAYPEQLRLKRDRVATLLRDTVGRFVPPVEATIGIAGDRTDPAAPWGYRHKVHFVLTRDRDNRIVMGHYRRGTRTVLPVVECPVHAGRGNAVAFAIRDRLNAAGPDSLRGVDLRHVVVRTSTGAETLTTLVVGNDEARVVRALAAHPAVVESTSSGLALNVNPEHGAYLFGRDTVHLRGAERIEDTIAGVRFRLSATSFFQTSPEAATRLVEVVLAAVSPGARRVLDLYAGCGLFALPLARRGHDVVAIEEHPVSLADGRDSLALNGISPERCRFIRARVEHFLQRRRAAMEEIRRGADTVVLDPPREGCPQDVLETILRGIAPRQAIYVSCDPDALARDLSRLVRARLLGPTGPYVVARVQPIDMFPHTAHIETVVVLKRQESR